MGNIQSVGLYQNPKKLHTRESLHHHSEQCTLHTIYHWAWKGTHKEHQKYFLPVYTYLWRETDQKHSVCIWCWPVCAALHGHCQVAQELMWRKQVNTSLLQRFTRLLCQLGMVEARCSKLTLKQPWFGPQTNLCQTFHFYLDCCFSSAHDSAHRTDISVLRWCLGSFLFFPCMFEEAWKVISMFFIVLNQRKVYFKFRSDCWKVTVLSRASLLI